MKSRLIYADGEKPQDPLPDFLKEQQKITLTKDEYKEIVKDAYKEGAKEALETHGSTSVMKKAQATETKQGEGEEEAVKAQAKASEQNKQKLDNIVKRHEMELLRTQSVFPFQFFPDTLIIDTMKVTIIQKTMFATEQISSCALKDLSDVQVQTAFFLATLYIKYMPQSNSPGMNEPREIKITALKREDAIRAKNICRGVMVAAAEKIDIASLSTKEVATLLEKFGSNEGVT